MHTNYEYYVYLMCSAQSKIARKCSQNRKIKNLTPSIDGECPLVSLCDILWRSDANRRSLRVYTTIRLKWKGAIEQLRHRTGGGSDLLHMII